MPLWVSTLPLGRRALAASLVAWYFYIRRPETPGAARRELPGVYRFLLNKWYFDELYDVLFVRPAQVARPRPVEGRRRRA